MRSAMKMLSLLQARRLEPLVPCKPTPGFSADCRKKQAAEQHAGLRLGPGGSPLPAGRSRQDRRPHPAALAGRTVRSPACHGAVRLGRGVNEYRGGRETPTLILQGTRDPFGSREEVEGYRLPSAVTIRWLEDGNHDF